MIIENSSNSSCTQAVYASMQYADSMLKIASITSESTSSHSEIEGRVREWPSFTYISASSLALGSGSCGVAGMAWWFRRSSGILPEPPMHRALNAGTNAARAYFTNTLNCTWPTTNICRWLSMSISLWSSISLKAALIGDVILKLTSRHNLVSGFTSSVKCWKIWISNNR